MATVAASNDRGAVTVINDATVSSITDSRHSGARARFRLLGHAGRSGIKVGFVPIPLCLTMSQELLSAITSRAVWLLSDPLIAARRPCFSIGRMTGPPQGVRGIAPVPGRDSRRSELNGAYLRRS